MFQILRCERLSASHQPDILQILKQFIPTLGAQITATVTEIDLSSRTATLAFADGSSKTFHVRDDIDLSHRKVGEKVVFRVTEMIALSVDKP